MLHTQILSRALLKIQPSAFPWTHGRKFLTHRQEVLGIPGIRYGLGTDVGCQYAALIAGYWVLETRLFIIVSGELEQRKTDTTVRAHHSSTSRSRHPALFYLGSGATLTRSFVRLDDSFNFWLSAVGHVTPSYVTNTNISALPERYRAYLKRLTSRTLEQRTQWGSITSGMAILWVTCRRPLDELPEARCWSSVADGRRASCGGAARWHRSRRTAESWARRESQPSG